MFPSGQRLRKKHFFRWRARCQSNGITAKQLGALWKGQRGRCALSGIKLGRDAHLDHIIPLSRGGSGGIGNLRWLDPWVNIARQNLSDEDFRKRCTQVAEFIGRLIIAADHSLRGQDGDKEVHAQASSNDNSDTKERAK